MIYNNLLDAAWILKKGGASIACPYDVKTTRAFCNIIQIMADAIKIFKCHRGTNIHKLIDVPWVAIDNAWMDGWRSLKGHSRENQCGLEMLIFPWK